MSDKSKSQKGMSFAGRVFVFCSPKGVVSVTCKTVPITLGKKKNASFSQKLPPEDSDQFQDLLRFRNISFVSGGSINSQQNHLWASTNLESKKLSKVRKNTGWCQLGHTLTCACLVCAAFHLHLAEHLWGKVEQHPEPRVRERWEGGCHSPSAVKNYWVLFWRVKENYPCAISQWDGSGLRLCPCPEQTDRQFAILVGFCFEVVVSFKSISSEQDRHFT